MRSIISTSLLCLTCTLLSSCGETTGIGPARADNGLQDNQSYTVRSSFKKEQHWQRQIAHDNGASKDTEAEPPKSSSSLSIPELPPAAVDKSVPVVVKVIDAEPLKTDRQIIEEFEQAEKTKKIFRTLARDVNRVAQRQAMQGDFKSAEQLLSRLVHLCRDPEVADQRNLGLALNNLGMLYCKRRKYGKAEALLQGSLLIQQQALGPESPAFAEGINNLATLYYEQLRYNDAEPLFHRAMEILKKAPDEYKPQLAKTMNNLAGCYSHTGRLKQAEDMLAEVLALDKRVLTDEHPDFAATINNLGYVYVMQQRYSKAQPLLHKAMQIAERSYGPQSVELVSYLDNYAYLMSRTNRAEESRKLKARANKILEMNGM